MPSGILPNSNHYNNDNVDDEQVLVAVFLIKHTRVNSRAALDAYANEPIY